MKYLKFVPLSLLLAARVGIATAQTQADSTSIKNDSITWNKELEGVEIKAQRQLIKQDIDRIGYDVQADEESKTLTVLDMLRKVPMVTVDGEDNIKVKGNSSFKIYKNGHYDPSLSKNAKEILKAMPASAVKRVEVITDPGAREDAEGVDAILNIVMMDGRRMDGVTGSVTASYNTLEHPNLSAYLTTQLGKAIVSLNYGYGGMSSKETENINVTERTYVASGNMMKSQNKGSNPGYIHMVDIDASYDIDSLNLLSASLSGYFYKLDVQGGGTTQMYSPTNNLLYGYSDTYWMPGYSHHSWNGRLDFQHKTRRKGELLTLSYMLALTRQNDQQETNYTDLQNTPFNYTRMLNDNHERFTEHTFQADYVHPITQGHKLEVGGKYIYRGNSSHTVQDFYATTPYPTYDSQFEHTTQVAAAYADYMVNLDKWSARAGLRYEHSYMKGHYPDGSDSDFGRHLNDWVPQASVKYQINDANSLKLEYTTSISRPGISYLNPAVVSSPTQVTYGNAELSSCRKQTIYLIYSYIGRWLTLQLAPAYKYFDDGIGRLVYAKDDIRYQTYGN
ncbi:MAG: outer membrane beta-barrel protein, partial [Prevotella sp.]|nr:outer membrane beta-barrel protein [Prevotella sp.]